MNYFPNNTKKITNMPRPTIYLVSTKVLYMKRLKSVIDFMVAEI